MLHQCLQNRGPTDAFTSLHCFRYKVEDNCRMSFPDSSFDVVVEKATLDSTITTLDAGAKRRARDMLAEVYRVLRPGGSLVSISINNPSIFKVYCSHPHLTVVEEQSLVRPKFDTNKRENTNMNFYVYSLRKAP